MSTVSGDARRGLIGLCWRFLDGPLRRYAVLGPFTKLLEAVFELFTPYLVARMVDAGVNAGDFWRALSYGAALVVMAIAGFTVTLAGQKMASLASQGMGTRMRDELYRRIGSFSAAELDGFGAASLITRLGPDVNQVQLACALAIRQLIRWPLMAVGSVIAALLIDFELGCIFLVCTPLISFLFWLVMARCVPYFKKIQVQLDAISRIVRENLSGIRVVRSSGREEHEVGRFRDAGLHQAATSIASGRLSSILNPATLIIMDLAICVILTRGGLAVKVGRLTQGEIMAFVNYMSQALLSISFIANLIVVFTKASASAERIEEVLACEPSVTGGGLGIEDADATAPAVEFEGVSFTYRSGAPEVLDNVSFTLERGGSLGIIGGTGSGKSTLASLLLRLYDANAGTIRIFGRDIAEYGLEALHGLVSLVPQKASLVSGTIRDNLVWRDPDADDEALWAALETAQAADFVRELEGGLDATVEAQGRNFSGGQRQRLSIARALMGGPAILVMDDASSALDYATEAALRDSLSAALPHAARVVISQRVPTVMACDAILVLDEGRVVGLGSHEELMEGCPAYHQIAELQLDQGKVA